MIEPAKPSTSSGILLAFAGLVLLVLVLAGCLFTLLASRYFAKPDHSLLPADEPEVQENAHLRKALMEVKMDRDRARLQLAINRLAIGGFGPKDTAQALQTVAGLKNSLELRATYIQEVKRHGKYWDREFDLPAMTYIDRIEQLEKQLAAEQARTKELTEALEKFKKD